MGKIEGLRLGANEYPAAVPLTWFFIAGISMIHTRDIVVPELIQEQ